mmetsp:Transcript_65882/g.190031  ORF Transcript_65882/g.190031 Transcript_65882/m.190031 type:complete len:295 (+) Transcript_65882:720-1604(+)
MPPLDSENELDDSERDPHNWKHQVGEHGVDAWSVDRERPLVPRDERLAEAREEDVMERDEACDVERCAPVRAPVQHRRRFRRDLRRADGDVKGRLCRADDENALALSEVGRVVLGGVDDLTFEFSRLLGPLGHVWHLTVHSCCNYCEVKLLLAGLAQLEYPTLLPRALSQGVNRCVQADQGQQLEMIGVCLDVSLDLWARWELTPRNRLKGKVQKLVQLLEHLDAIRVVVLLPQAPDFRCPVEYGHLITVATEGAGHLQARHSGPDDSDFLHVGEVSYLRQIQRLVRRHRNGWW